MSDNEKLNQQQLSGLVNVINSKASKYRAFAIFFVFIIISVVVSLIAFFFIFTNIDIRWYNIQSEIDGINKSLNDLQMQISNTTNRVVDMQNNQLVSINKFNDSLTNSVLRISELTRQSENGNYTSEDRIQIIKEINILIDSIKNSAANTNVELSNTLQALHDTAVKIEKNTTDTTDKLIAYNSGNESLLNNLINTIVKLSSVAIAVFLIQILVGYTRYHFQMADNLYGLTYALKYVELTGNKDSLKELIITLSTNKVQFGKMPTTPIEQVIDLLKQTIEKYPKT